MTLFYNFLSQNVENQYKTGIVSLEDIVHEAVLCIKTVICLNLKDYFKLRFRVNLNYITRIGFKRALVLGFGFDLSAMLINLVQAVMFFYGLKLTVEGEYALAQVMEVVVLMMFSVGSMMSMLSSVPNLSRGLRASSKIKELLELKDDPNLITGFSVPNFRAFEGSSTYELKNVSFAYPTMKEKNILSHVSLSIPKNEILCLVGESGCAIHTKITFQMRS
ncbi:unnamed protein product [Ambrosiozyma monospora]|uniref:Unnamed protein product n=1 Tax=Ambrosiozyma monospora TaxID=43982 RepID=A0ACB5UA69_AMBMO|nr:unnamed protein product [Ambrosiozyma monospora]